MTAPCKAPQAVLMLKSDTVSCAGTTAVVHVHALSVGHVAGKKKPFSGSRIKMKQKKILSANGIHKDWDKGQHKVLPVASTSAKQFSAATKVQPAHPRKMASSAKTGRKGEIEKP